MTTFFNYIYTAIYAFRNIDRKSKEMSQNDPLDTNGIFLWDPWHFEVWLLLSPFQELCLIH